MIQLFENEPFLFYGRSPRLPTGLLFQWLRVIFSVMKRPMSGSSPVSLLQIFS